MTDSPTGGLPLKVASLQKIDRWLFGPLCFVLTLFRKTYDLFRGAHSKTFRNILFVKLAEQGSTILAVAAIRHAVNLVGRENVYFAVFAENRFVLDVMELIPPENVFIVKTTSVGTMAGDTLRAIFQMRRIGFDAAVDLEFFARFSAAITYLSGARWRSGMHAYFGEGPFRGDLMTHRVLYNPHIHTSEMFYAMVQALSQAPEVFPTFNLTARLPEQEPPSFTPAVEEAALVRALICEKTKSNSVPPLILLNPNAGDFLPLRRWPMERYSELARRILQELPEAWIAFTGLENEREATERLVRESGSGRCFSLAGQTTLRQLLVLYGLSQVLVTNDSGPAHFATLTPIHVVTLFGPETPDLFGARSGRNHIVYAGIACSPCINALNNRQSSCRNNVCMQNLTVENILARVLQAYAERKSEIRS